jgi:prophage regulatory protein
MVRNGTIHKGRTMPKNSDTETSRAGELRILRRRQVEDRVGLSCSTIYAGVAAGTFPKPIQLGAQSVGWLESEIDTWLRDRVAASRGEVVQS